MNGQKMTVNSEAGKNADGKVLWLEKLGCADLIKAILTQSFSDSVVYYGERSESAAARRILSLMNRGGERIRVFPLSLSLEKNSPDGQVLNYKVIEDMSLCINRFLDIYAGGRSLRMKNAVTCCMSVWLRRRVPFAVIVESKAKLMKGKSHTIKFSGNPANRTLYSLYRDRGFTVKESSDRLGYMRPLGRMLKLTASDWKVRSTGLGKNMGCGFWDQTALVLCDPSWT